MMRFSAAGLYKCNVFSQTYAFTFRSVLWLAELVEPVLLQYIAQFVRKSVASVALWFDSLHWLF